MDIAQRKWKEKQRKGSVSQPDQQHPLGHRDQRQNTANCSVSERKKKVGAGAMRHFPNTLKGQQSPGTWKIVNYLKYRFRGPDPP